MYYNIIEAHSTCTHTLYNSTLPPCHQEEEEEEEEGGATSRLVVSQVQPLDSGSFSCTATNAPLSAAGKRAVVSSTSNITVLSEWWAGGAKGALSVCRGRG